MGDGCCASSLSASISSSLVSVVGVAYGCWLMPLRVDLTTGMNQNRADAINYVADQAVLHAGSRRYVVNCSWRMNGDHAGGTEERRGQET